MKATLHKSLKLFLLVALPLPLACAANSQQRAKVVTAQDEAQETLTLRIGNMDDYTTPDDMTRLETAVRGVHGVTFASAAGTTGELEVRHSATTRREDIERAIEKAGFWLDDGTTEHPAEETDDSGWDSYEDAEQEPASDPTAGESNAEEEQPNYDEYDDEPSAQNQYDDTYDDE